MTVYYAEAESVTLHARNQIWVRAELRPDDTLAFVGHDLNPTNAFGAEYEYEIVVGGADIRRLIAAVRGKPVDDPDNGRFDILALLRVNRLWLLQMGEEELLKRSGIEYRFWNRVGDRLDGGSGHHDG